MVRLCLVSALIISLSPSMMNASGLTEIDPLIIQQINQLTLQKSLDCSTMVDTYSRAEYNWLIDQYDYFNSQGAAPAGQPPYISLAGYLDTDISWEDGGQFTMLAYVTDSDSNVASVEIYWDGNPTGVYLRDDGLNGDFGPGDNLWGITFPIDPMSVPTGEYLLELRARDDIGNLSDLWPYLTIHP